MAHRFAFVNSEGELKGIVSPGSDDQYVNLQSYGDVTAVIIPTDVDNDSLMVTGWYDFVDDVFKERLERPAEYYIWQGGSWVLDSVSLFESIRGKRDTLLSLSDWTQLVDSPLTDSKKAEWVTYRTTLRDIPETYTDVTTLDEVVWPTPPTGAL